MAEDLRRRIRWMEEELRSEEAQEDAWEEEFASFPPDPGRAMFQDEDYGTGETPRKNANTRGLRYLLFLEILGILAVIGWWIRWLI